MRHGARWNVNGSHHVAHPHEAEAMIEFKADCGHTVRAKDEDAGSAVRCSYCGKSANVPNTQDAALDLLFEEAGAAANRALVTERPSRRRRFLRKGPRSGGRFNPFPVILRLCYAALLISVVIVVTRKFVLPLFDKQTAVPKQANPSFTRPPPPQNDVATTTAPSGRGLLDRSQLGAFYVASTPTGATVFIVNTADAPASGRIHRAKGCTTLRPGGGPPRISDGIYVVELALPWNETNLKKYRGYSEFRANLQKADESSRRRLMEEYFIPDDASALFVDQTDDQIFLVRQYRDVEVRDGRSKGVRGLYLPRLRNPGDTGFSIEQLVVDCIPENTQYSFDEVDVRSELEFYGVPAGDLAWVIRSLHRIGVMSYQTASRGTLAFKIGLEDGVFAAKIIREPGK